MSALANDEKKSTVIVTENSAFMFFTAEIWSCFKLHLLFKSWGI